MGLNPLAILNPSMALGAVTAGASYLGQKEANETNKEIAAATTAANMAESSRNREFQERMSNTAFQRQMEDLRKSGINPLLVTGMSGASTPSGSAGSGATATVQNELAGLPDAIQAGVAIHNQQLASAKQGAEIGLMAEQQKLARAQSGKAAMETTVLSKDLPIADFKNKVYNWAKDAFSQKANTAKDLVKTPQQWSDFKKKQNEESRARWEKALKVQRDEMNNRKLIMKGPK